MSYRVIVRPDAQREIEEIANYIGGSQPAAARRFIEQVQRHCHDLAEWPRTGSPKGDRFDIGRDVRRVPVHGFVNFGIFYSIEGEVVSVEHVTHGAALP